MQLPFNLRDALSANAERKCYGTNARRRSERQRPGYKGTDNSSSSVPGVWHDINRGSSKTGFYKLVRMQRADDEGVHLERYIIGATSTLFATNPHWAQGRRDCPVKATNVYLNNKLR